MATAYRMISVDDGAMEQILHDYCMRYGIFEKTHAVGPSEYIMTIDEICDEIVSDARNKLWGRYNEVGSNRYGVISTIAGLR